MNVCATKPATAESYLRQRAADLLAADATVRRIGELSAGVWKIDLDDGAKLVAKCQPHGWPAAHATYGLLNVETQVLDLLAAARCPVPRVLATDPETQFIFFQHRGDHTLDDMCQKNSAGLKTLARRAVSGFCLIERTLASHLEIIASLAHPAVALEHLPKTLTAMGAQAHNGLDYLLGERAPATELHAMLDDIAQHIGNTAPTLGSTDYNALNIVVDQTNRQPSFLEFAKIGWDWPERRLVQYLTSLGGGRPRGRFHSLVDANLVKWYTRCAGGNTDERALALDAHHILFHLNAAALLGRALQAPHQQPHAALLTRWRQPRRRMEQLARALSAKLGTAQPTARFRALLRHTIDAGETQL